MRETIIDDYWRGLLSTFHTCLRNTSEDGTYAEDKCYSVQEELLANYEELANPVSIEPVVAERFKRLRKFKGDVT
eukprot:3216-Eustigmatos_ZCMA.PRE.1